MSANPPGFTVAQADYARDHDALRAVREAVFVREQGVPLELELDAQDPDCLHVLARDAAGRPIGTGRLTPAHTLGRMAVLPEWRGKGVGAALLAALTELARERRWNAIELHAQADAVGFYLRHGYLPFGPCYMEAGIEHQSMRRALGGPNAVEDREAAIAATIGIIAATRRGLRAYSRALDPGLFDAPPVLDALRRLAVRGDGVELRFLLQDDCPWRYRFEQFEAQCRGQVLGAPQGGERRPDPLPAGARFKQLFGDDLAKLETAFFAWLDRQ